MRRHLLATAAALAVALPALSLAGAAATPAAAQATTAAAQPGMRIEANQIRAKDLMDRDVYSSDGVEIGEVEDLVIDPASGRIVTAVVEVESRLGFTDKYVAVPLDQLRLTAGERRITLPMTREQVRGLRGIAYRD